MLINYFVVNINNQFKKLKVFHSNLELFLKSIKKKNYFFRLFTELL